MLKGIDVSEWQGQIDWRSVAPQIDFVNIRGGDGVTHFDSYARVNREQARDLGLLVAHYWYLRPADASPLLQADVIAGALGTIRPGEPIVLDVEDYIPGIVAYVENLADFIQNWFGQPPMLYINRDALGRYDWGPVYQLDVGLWLADWDTVAAAPLNVAPWAFAAAKQYNDAGKIDGITPNVDLDVFYGDAEQFKAYGVIPPA